MTPPTSYTNICERGLSLVKEGMMEKFNKFNTEFSVVRDIKGNQNYLNFRTTSIKTTLCLSNKEWNNLKRFLKATKTRKALSKNAQGYQGFIINENKITFYSLEFHIRFIKAMADQAKKFKDGKEKWVKTSITLQKRVSKTVEKTLLDSEMHLMIGETSIGMTRAKFKKFREYCLKF